MEAENEFYKGNWDIGLRSQNEPLKSLKGKLRLHESVMRGFSLTIENDNGDLACRIPLDNIAYLVNHDYTA